MRKSLLYKFLTIFSFSLVTLSNSAYSFNDNKQNISVDSLNENKQNTILDSLEVSTQNTLIDSLNVNKHNTFEEISNENRQNNSVDSLVNDNPNTFSETLNFNKNNTFVETPNVNKQNNSVDFLNDNNPNTLSDSLNVNKHINFVDISNENRQNNFANSLVNNKENSSSHSLTSNIPNNGYQYNQMYVLGDSLSDIGSLMGIATNFFQSTGYFEKNRELHFDKYYHEGKQFSTGNVGVQVLANKLGLVLEPGWEISDKIKQVGNNYATGGSRAGTFEITANNLANIENEFWTNIKNNFYSGYENMTGILGNLFNLSAQVNGLIKQHGKLDNRDLVIIESGNNDFFTALSYEENQVEKMKATVDKAIFGIETAIKTLIANNAHHILVSNIANIARTPEYLVKKHNIAEELVSYYDYQWIKMINNVKAIGDNKNKIKELDLFSLTNEKLLEAEWLEMNITESVVDNPMTRLNLFFTFCPIPWFENLKGKINVHFADTKQPADLKNHFFLDSVHPTAWMHNEIGEEMYKIVQSW